jgi:hypothetical protein
MYLVILYYNYRMIGKVMTEKYLHIHQSIQFHSLNLQMYKVYNNIILKDASYTMHYPLKRLVLRRTFIL